MIAAREALERLLDQPGVRTAAAHARSSDARTLDDQAELSGIPAPPFEEGQPFPLLKFPALDDGRPLSVADFRGRKIVLHVFASW